LDEKHKLKNILARNISQGGVQALIGHESDCEEISGCSIITSSYRLANKNVGIIGVIGPTRMKYDKMVPIVDRISKLVSALLDRMSQ
jgi:heat-inducible transcriptional repressor